MIRGDSIEGAIVASVAYFDIFACAPFASEVHRFLLAHRAERRDVERALEGRALREYVGYRDGCFFLAGKDHLALRRLRNRRHGEALWPIARRIARVVEATGLASLGMVTGSLAAENADEHADIDFLFSYPAERAWSSYAAVRLLAKLKVGGLDKLCPNYVLTDAKLEIRPQNVFTAWEIAKAVPLFGFDVYRAFLEANQWVSRYLPNALPQLPAQAMSARTSSALTRSKAFRRLEELERRRKFKRDEKDVGIDMESRLKTGSTDRHSPTRSFIVLSELRYRLELFGLRGHPLFAEIQAATSMLATEMQTWGEAPLPAFLTQPSTTAATQCVTHSMVKSSGL